MWFFAFLSETVVQHGDSFHVKAVVTLNSVLLMNNKRPAEICWADGKLNLHVYKGLWVWLCETQSWVLLSAEAPLSWPDRKWFLILKQILYQRWHAWFILRFLWHTDLHKMFFFYFVCSAINTLAYLHSNPASLSDQFLTFTEMCWNNELKVRCFYTL